MKDVRGFSDFGFSYVYIIFEEGTDIYWARSRTLEYLSKILPRLPGCADRARAGRHRRRLGLPVCAGGRSGSTTWPSCARYQDWYLRYHLQSVPGVAEVAPLGGFVRQYQVNVDPNRLAAYGIPISKVVAAVRSGNNDVGGRLVEFTGREYMVRGRGYARSHGGPRAIVARGQRAGVPIRVRDVGSVALGPDIRRGVADLDGQGRSGLRHRRHAPGRERAGASSNA